MLEKPESVAADEFKSAKWDELTRGRRFEQSDAPALALLCQWHKVAQPDAPALALLRQWHKVAQQTMNELEGIPPTRTTQAAPRHHRRS